MILYHASNVVIEKPDVFHSREYLDFGKGFYLTVLYEQARKYAMRFLLRGKCAYINTYALDDRKENVRRQTFKSYDEEWLDYAGRCRKGMCGASFDIVEGGIANDRVFNTIDWYFSGAMSKEDALGRLTFEHPNHQLCILSQDVIERYLHFVKAEKIENGGV